MGKTDFIRSPNNRVRKSIHQKIVLNDKKIKIINFVFYVPMGSNVNLLQSQFVLNG